MEISSHGLVQNRVKNIPFHIGIFTNLTQDHLDYHKNMKQYELAKWSFFNQHQINKIILNANDKYAKKWLKKLSNKYTVSVTIKDKKQKKYAIKWLNAIDIKYNDHCTNVEFNSSWGSGILSTCLIGYFNIQNLLLSLACMLEMNYKLSDLLFTSIKLQPIIGRMQKFNITGKPTIIIDYAHTPDALKQALNTIRSYYLKKKIWCIFGCGGERDQKNVH
jgi:UDP-N-acetylmuramoyl-L-alanyl-D-glutamate--2,6-diaminopimelate ligase